MKVDEPPEGPPTGKAMTVRLMGDDFDVLRRLSRGIQDDIRGVDGLVNLDDDFDRGKPELRPSSGAASVQPWSRGLNTQTIVCRRTTGSVALPRWKPIAVIVQRGRS